MLKNINSLKKTLSTTQKNKIILIFVMSFFIPFMEVLSIATLGALILFVIDVDNIVKMIPIQNLEDFVKSIDKTTLIYVLSVFVLVLIIFKNLFLLLYSFLAVKLQKEIISSHSLHIYKHYMNKKFIDLTYLNTPGIQNDILGQSSKISYYIFFNISLLKDFLLALLFIFGLLAVNFKVTIFLIFIALIFSILYFLFTRKKIKNFGLQANFFDRELIKITQYTFVGIKSIIIFSKKKFFQNRFIEIIEQKIKNEIWYDTISKLPRLILEIAFAACIVLFMNFSIKSEDDISKILPFLVFLSLISIRLLPIFSNLNLVMTNIKHIEPVVEKLLKFWDVPTILTKAPLIDLEKQNFNNLNYIGLKNVYFNYKTSDKNIINNLSFKFEKNKIYALTGTSGAGKSTLIDIICGFLEPSTGRVEANGKNIYQNIELWRQQIAFVPQDNFLLNDTIIANISFVDLGKETNMKRFNDAIEQSDLIEFIDMLPKKEMTITGDRGINISGGQKQRIGLARALYKNGNFIALDEATNSVDKDSEVTIIDTLHKIKKGKIIIVIAHSQSTINLCDEVILLKNGEVKFTGKPESYFSQNKS